MSEKKFDISKILKDFEEQLGREAVSALVENRQELEELGQLGFYEIMKALKNGRKSQIDEVMQIKLLLTLSDEDLLAAKKSNIEALKKVADAVERRRKLVDDLINKVGKKAASILVTHMLLAL
jgi:hypothetical protein